MERQAKEREYTYEDYLTWPEEERWELIDGVRYPTYGTTALAGASTRHQEILSFIHFRVSLHLQGKPCKVFPPGTDVMLDPKRKKFIFQPDILVVCDKDKIKNNVIEGPPDFVVEIQSSSTAKKDFFDKLNAYERYGVKEYWIVTQSPVSILQLVLAEGDYRKTEIKEGAVRSHVLDGFSLDIQEMVEYIQN